MENKYDINENTNKEETSLLIFRFRKTDFKVTQKSKNYLS